MLSVIVPARDEEKFIGPCLESIRAAAGKTSQEVEIIVVLNRCTDRTEEIARGFGATIVNEDAKNLAKIRNAGVRAARGDVIVTIDADSRMSINMLADIEVQIASGKTVGGGTNIYFERYSFPLRITHLIALTLFVAFGISAGLFWCRKKDFDLIGGFNEKLLIAEDGDFAIRLKRLGKKQKRPFKTIWSSYITTSCRKFDRLGDWFLLKSPRVLYQMAKNSRQAADKIWYDFER